MISDAVFSSDRVYRYSLTRTWDISLATTLFIGLNPSTADEKEDDPTIRRCMGFAQRWGHGGIVMSNIFAFRATDPYVMKMQDDPVGPDNDATLLRLATEAQVVIACWGVHGIHRARDREVRRLLREIDLRCFGETQGGQPRHPLYLRADSSLLEYGRRSKRK